MHSICNLNYNLSKEIPTDFRNGFNYDCRFIIKELAEEFEKKYLFRRKQQEIHNLYSTKGKRSYKNVKNGDPKNDKNGEEITKNISYILHFLIAQDL